ncbi:hypothetical protein [Neptunicella sp. SCSIO 80796]|uniref:hypothetical protein n=1 Tax=Neptunicella plasticusilytica TaxID=3117012 RepID=UPI003A4D588D
MIKKKHTGVIFALIFLAGLFVLVKINNHQLSDANKSYCSLEHGQCEINQGEQSILLQIQPESIPLEEELSLTFTLPSGYNITRGWITGINMYMGKIPLIIESVDNNQTQAVTFLGSCSEPDMQWLMTLEVENTHRQQTDTLYFRFRTHR